MSEENVYVGLPTLSLLPMKSCKFKTVTQIEIELPKKGSYNELAPDLFPEEHGEFDFSDATFVYLPAITKVLIATGKYPKLEHNQLFTPLGIELRENTIAIPGQVLEIISIEP